MRSTKRIAVILLVSVVCISAGFGTEDQNQLDPYENTSILVEAFVVRVSTEALAEAGVSPIGQGPKGISILKIMSCLDDPEKAAVVSGAKVVAGHNEESEVHNRNTTFFKTENGNSVSYNAYENGIQFEVSTYIEKAIHLQYTFSTSFAEEDRKSSGPPNTFSLDWRGGVSAASGKPFVAGAVQDDDSTTFLILCATIQESDD